MYIVFLSSGNRALYECRACKYFCVIAGFKCIWPVGLHIRSQCGRGSVGEPVSVQTFISRSSVEQLDIRILIRLAKQMTRHRLDGKLGGAHGRPPSIKITPSSAGHRWPSRRHSHQHARSCAMAKSSRRAAFDGLAITVLEESRAWHS